MTIEGPGRDENNFEKFAKKVNRNKLVYESPDEKPGCDKKDHAQRSLVNQPNHRKFWKKNDTKDT